jgi:hypothetical protein
MLAIERELVAAVYVLYAADCVHWLKPGQGCAARGLTGGWKRREYREDSFTLLGRMPVAANPLDLRPGWIVYSLKAAGGDVVRPESIDEFIQKSMPNRGLLTALAAIAGVNLLVLLPAALATGLLGLLWTGLALTVLATHLGIAVEFYLQARWWRAADSGQFWREYVPLLLNPLAALRAGDVLCRALFDLKAGDKLN